MAFEEDVEYRKALPRDYLGYMGVAFSDDVSSRFHLSLPSSMVALV